MTCTDYIDALLMNTKIKFLLSCRRSVVLLLVQAAAQTSCYVLWYLMLDRNPYSEGSLARLAALPEY
jgi:hypothetical protein